jgi:hypothetical protein
MAEAEALVEAILAIPGDRGHRAVETVFLPEPPKRRLFRRRNRHPADEIRTGWRIGCYIRSVPASSQTGYRVRREFSHPVYLLSDGRVVIGAFRVVDAEGAVSELDTPHARRPSWFTAVEDSREFFVGRPEHYLDELKALHADRTRP